MANLQNATFMQSKLKVIADASRFGFARAFGVVDKIEKNIEAEIERNKTRPLGKLSRFRRTGERVFKNRLTLCVIIILNVIECVLILSELIVDVNEMQKMVQKRATSTDKFVSSLQEEYPSVFQSVDKTNIDHVYRKIIAADIIWKNDSGYPRDDGTSIRFVPLPTDEPLRRHRRELDTKKADSVSEPETEKTGSARTSKTKTAQKHFSINLHFASMTILCFLLVVTIVKVFCYGVYFQRKKLQVFDGCILLFSFALDIGFINAITTRSLESLVLVLAFLLPWRVIRVVNNLIITVKNHAHWKLKLIYNEKKAVEKELKEVRQLKKDCKNTIQVLRRLCLEEGVTPGDLGRTLTLYGSVRRLFSKRKKGQLDLSGQTTTSSCLSLDMDPRASTTAIVHHANDPDSIARFQKMRRLSKGPMNREGRDVSVDAATVDDGVEICDGLKESVKDVQKDSDGTTDGEVDSNSI
ncbi:hypothetical protein ScPMuIL_016565 [Solemya velum]